MKVDFELVEKTFTNDKNDEVKYYVLQRRLIDNTILTVPIKSDKSKLLAMSLVIENKTRKE